MTVRHQGLSKNRPIMAEVSGRQQVVNAGLTAAAVAAITPLMSGVGFEELGKVKGLLKQFFSDQPWETADIDALADAVGAGEGNVEQELAPGLWLRAGWTEGGFRLDVEGRPDAGGQSQPSTDLASTFEFGVVPEATPNPRTLRFATAPSQQAASRSFRRGDPIDDARVEQIFDALPDAIDVLVGPDFVAISLDRPGRWPGALEVALRVVGQSFGGVDGEEPQPRTRGGPSALVGRSAATATARSQTSLEKAWAELGHLRPQRDGDLAIVLAAVADPDPSRRQVIASLLREAPPEDAAGAWATLGTDPSRRVRRATVDAVVDVGRESLRPILERLTGDSDAWIRWKAIHGLAELGVEPSRMTIEAAQSDPDFRVRLEASTALGRPLS
jgi:hypothetical protein